MPRRGPAKLIGLILGAAVALIVLVLAALSVWLTYYAKPRVETLASAAVGLQVSIAGSVRVGLIPTLHLTANQVHMQAMHTELIGAQQLVLALDPIAALHRRAHISSLDVTQLQVTLDRDRKGKLDLRHLQTPPGPTPDLTIARASATDAKLTYRDEATQGGFVLEGCQVDLRGLQLLPGHPSADWLKVISFEGKTGCQQFTLRDLRPTDIRFSVKAADGHMNFAPAELRWLGGAGKGTLQADFTGNLPHYLAHYELGQFKATEFFKLFTPKRVGEGPLILKADLSMRGFSIEHLRRSLTGNAALHGEQLTLYMGDLDKKFAHFESAQNFTLVDSAAFVFAGPIGLGISKGYDYAQILQGNEGSTVITKLVSAWNLEQGIAAATDVAMATRQNRLAVQGKVNLGTDEIEELRVALIDAQGCTEALQKVHGPFSKPKLDPPNVVKLLTTPGKRLIRKAARLLGEKCVAFYSGSVEPPPESVQPPPKSVEPPH